MNEREKSSKLHSVLGEAGGIFGGVGFEQLVLALNNI